MQDESIQQQFLFQQGLSDTAKSYISELMSIILTDDVIEKWGRQVSRAEMARKIAPFWILACIWRGIEHGWHIELLHSPTILSRMKLPKEWIDGMNQVCIDIIKKTMDKIITKRPRRCRQVPIAPIFYRDSPPEEWPTDEAPRFICKIGIKTRRDTSSFHKDGNNTVLLSGIIHLPRSSQQTSAVKSTIFRLQDGRIYRPPDRQFLRVYCHAPIDHCSPTHISYDQDQQGPSEMFLYFSIMSVDHDWCVKALQQLSQKKVSHAI